jgi:hypothetical protein
MFAATLKIKEKYSCVKGECECYGRRWAERIESGGAAVELQYPRVLFTRERQRAGGG